MTTQTQLAALDAAATQGTFEMLTTDLEHDFGVPVIGTDYPSTYGPSNGMALWATMLPTEIDAKDASRAEATARFVVTLVNLYRAGKLVLVPSVEEVAADIACNSPSGLQYPWHTAAALQVLASMGAKTDGTRETVGTATP